MNFLISPLLELNEFNEILAAIKRYTAPINISGPSDSQKAHISYAISSNSELKGIYIAFNEMHARKMYDDFSYFYRDDVLFFPSKEIMLHDIEAKSNDSIFQRLITLDKVIKGDYKMIVTSAEAFMQKLMPVTLFQHSIETFTLGGRVNLTELPQRLVSMGYERVSVVEARGQFSIRGGIIDLFSIDSDNAFRIELFDDEVDSIRTFDITTQRSIQKLSEVRIIPAREIIYTPENRSNILERIEGSLERSLKKIKNNSEYSEQLKNRISHDMDRLRNDYYFPGIDKLTPFIFENPGNILDYAWKTGHGLVYIDEQARIKQRVENVLLELQESCKTLTEKGQILSESYEIHYDFEALITKLMDNKVINLNTISVSGQNFNPDRNISIPSKLLNSYQGHMELLLDDVKHWKSKKSKVVILAGTKGKGQRVLDTFESQGIAAAYSDELDHELQPGEVVITRGNLNKGFEYPEVGLVIVSDMEVFGKSRKHIKYGGKKEGSKLKAFTDLNPGDYVVHQAHGIGLYVGIQKLSVDNVKKDYLKIRYQDEGFIYIPTNQLELIQKYIGSEGKAPKLSKLGGTDWLKTKNRVRESLKELAGELIKLYAQRRSLRGHQFARDTVWQKQFEELFPYEETGDQLKCIEDIKQDMESERPMDRLLCGDVGYGKTEVAIRAIFKAAIDGKQIAYLVPTTILAQQHFNNFKQRMKDFPVTV
ncbi:MAG: transcription-repair coupling factor Mfd, partial [Clostridiales bacterium]|nr:transcription-repair coupling factor Mfd [Clostridiales bacterium]